MEMTELRTEFLWEAIDGSNALAGSDSSLAKCGTILDPAALLRLHWTMLRIRRVEEAIQRLYPEREIRCPTHLCIGQEAVPAGVAAHLKPGDYVFSGHRSHGHYLAKGGDLRSMIAELYGRETGCARGRGGSQHLIDLRAGFVASAPILAGTVPIAVGAAFGAKRRGEHRVSVVFVGDGTTEEGAFHEALNFASVHKLPVLIVCENNLYSVHSSLAIRQPDRSVSEVGRGHSIPGTTTEGNDVEAVWNTIGPAIARIRAGGGPELHEFMTYRWTEHCGPNDDTSLGYRSRDELEAWKERCPIRLSEARLRKACLLDDERLSRAIVEIDSEIEDAVAFARASAFPSPETLHSFVFPI
jgi:TPP-dependent pyruvate/acetoin dehydrogenase alpha subunit